MKDDEQDSEDISMNAKEWGGAMAVTSRAFDLLNSMIYQSR